MITCVTWITSVTSITSIITSVTAISLITSELSITSVMAFLSLCRRPVSPVPARVLSKKAEYESTSGLVPLEKEHKTLNMASLKRYKKIRYCYYLFSMQHTKVVYAGR